MGATFCSFKEFLNFSNYILRHHKLDLCFYYNEEGFLSIKLFLSPTEISMLFMTFHSPIQEWHSSALLGLINGRGEVQSTKRIWKHRGIFYGNLSADCYYLSTVDSINMLHVLTRGLLYCRRVVFSIVYDSDLGFFLTDDAIRF